MPKHSRCNKEQRKGTEIIASFYRTFEINPSQLTAEELSMIALGVTLSIDDNLLFGIAQHINNYAPPEEHYYFMRAKFCSILTYRIKLPPGLQCPSGNCLVIAVNSFPLDCSIAFTHSQGVLAR